MFRTAVCSGQREIREEFCTKLETYKELSFSTEKWEIKEFKGAEDLFNEDQRMDIYFVDIDYLDMDGLVAVQMLKEKWNVDITVILIGKMERIKDGYLAGAYRYLTKPIDFLELKEGLNSYRKMTIESEYIRLKQNGDELAIKKKDIRYLCRENGFTIMYAKSFCFKSLCSLSNWEQRLNNEDFIRCHKGYLVNLEYVTKIEEMAILKNGEKIPVSRRKKSEMIKLFIKYKLQNET